MKKEIKYNESKYNNYFEGPISQENIKEIIKNIDELNAQLILSNIVCAKNQFILLLPKNTLDKESISLIGEALSNKNCQKYFKAKLATMKYEDVDLYKIFSELTCSEDDFKYCVTLIEEEISELQENIKIIDIYGVLKNIFCLLDLTQAVMFYITISKSYFENNNIMTIYKYMVSISKMYVEFAHKLFYTLFPDCLEHQILNCKQ